MPAFWSWCPILEHELGALLKPLVRVRPTQCAPGPAAVSVTPLAPSDPAAINRLEELATKHRLPVAAGVSDYRWWPRRKRRTAVAAIKSPGAAIARAQAELQALVKDVRKEMAV